jgi:hypothetical protein
VGRVEADLGALRGGVRRGRRGAVVAEDVVQRRLQVGVAEPLDYHAEHARQLPLHRRRPVHADDGSDPDRGVERGPEVELVGSVGLALGGDDAAEGGERHEETSNEWYVPSAACYVLEAARAALVHAQERPERP